MTSEAGDRRSGIDRRTLIKRAAAAGAAAWTAPVIIDSLASPAAAQTAPPGNYRFQVDRAGSTCTFGAAFTNSGTCDPTGWGTTFVTQIPSDCQPTAGTCGPNVTPITFTIPAGCNCTFTQTLGLTNTGSCVTGSGAGTQSTTLIKPGGGQWVSFRFTITCT